MKRILPKRQFGRREPSVMWEMLLSDVGQFVISFNQWTSTFAVRLPANCASPMSNN